MLQGIDDAESEWSQHHAKRMIDTRAKGLRGCIPPNFPYFHVEFGLSGVVQQHFGCVVAAAVHVPKL